MIYVATALWCENRWVIAAGRDRAWVEKTAAAYLKAHPDTCNAAGQFAFPDSQGRAAEDYMIEEVEESPSTPASCELCRHCSSGFMGEPSSCSHPERAISAYEPVIHKFTPPAWCPLRADAIPYDGSINRKTP